MVKCDAAEDYCHGNSDKPDFKYGHCRQLEASPLGATPT